MWFRVTHTRMNRSCKLNYSYFEPSAEMYLVYCRLERPPPSDCVLGRRVTEHCIQKTEKRERREKREERERQRREKREERERERERE